MMISIKQEEIMGSAPKLLALVLIGRSIYPRAKRLFIQPIFYLIYRFASFTFSFWFKYIYGNIVNI